MRYAIAVAALSVLTGCAASLQETRQIARATPDWELCYYAVSGRGQPNWRQAVYETLQARRTDCNQHAQLVSAQIAADAQRSAAQTNLGLMLMQAGRPQPVAPMRPTTYCRSVSRGTYVETVCD